MSMGRFVNPENKAFRAAIKSEIYVDKSMLLDYTNKVLGTTQAFICNSRPRRFGKSITADMLTAYYSIGCNSSEIFDKLAISSTDNYEKNLNKYNVIHLDIQWCIEPAGKPENVISFITQNIISELRELYPAVLKPDITSLPDSLSRINFATGSQFIIIIDEWDVFIRDSYISLVFHVSSSLTSLRFNNSDAIMIFLFPVFTINCVLQDPMKYTLLSILA